MLSGGSAASVSETWAATTVTVQVSLVAKSTPGFNVREEPLPLTTAVWAPLLPQEIVNQVPVTFTDSLKLIVMSSSVATPVALFAGVVLETLGATSSPVTTTLSTRARTLPSELVLPRKRT